MKKGYIHIYTGNGKGKTSAALGVALRSLGNGYSVAIGQFVKSPNFEYNEMKALSAIREAGIFPGRIEIRQFGSGCCICHDPVEEDADGARKGFEIVTEWIMSGEWDTVILDELNIALRLNLLKLEEVIDLIKNKPAGVNLIITGRHAPDELIALADVVTEMKEIKHYFTRGILSQPGLDK